MERLDVAMLRLLNGRYIHGWGAFLLVYLGLFLGYSFDVYMQVCAVFAGEGKRRDILYVFFFFLDFIPLFFLLLLFHWISHGILPWFIPLAS